MSYWPLRDRRDHRVPARVLDLEREVQPPRDLAHRVVLPADRLAGLRVDELQRRVGVLGDDVTSRPPRSGSSAAAGAASARAASAARTGRRMRIGPRGAWRAGGECGKAARAARLDQVGRRGPSSPRRTSSSGRWRRGGDSRRPPRVVLGGVRRGRAAGEDHHGVARAEHVFVRFGRSTRGPRAPGRRGRSGRDLLAGLEAVGPIGSASTRTAMSRTIAGPKPTLTSESARVPLATSSSIRQSIRGCTLSFVCRRDSMPW